MEDWDRLKILAWAGAGRVGGNIIQLLNIGLHGLDIIFVFSIKAWSLEGQKVFKGHQISIDKKQKKT